jgi:LmbE family N-acetylglucosaminyl deacetylase
VLEGVAGVLPDGALALAPAALGDHPDHRIARDVALTLRSRGARVALYADLPHAVRYGWPAWVTGTAGVPFLDSGAYWEAMLDGTSVAVRDAEVRTLSESELQCKLEAIRCYRTQIAALEAGYSTLRDPEVMRYEVIWPL